MQPHMVASGGNCSVFWSLLGVVWASVGVQMGVRCNYFISLEIGLFGVTWGQLGMTGLTWAVYGGEVH